MLFGEGLDELYLVLGLKQEIIGRLFGRTIGVSTCPKYAGSHLRQE